MNPFVDLHGVCSKCDHDGTICVWRQTNETDQCVAQRHSETTRLACVTGCRYQAAAIGEKDDAA
jgi:hypothetical protein